MRVWVDLKNSEPEFFEGVEKVEWRAFSTLRGGPEHGDGPYLVVYGKDDRVLGEYQKQWVRGYRFRDDVKVFRDVSRFYGVVEDDEDEDEEEGKDDGEAEN